MDTIYVTGLHEKFGEVRGIATGVGKPISLALDYVNSTVPISVSDLTNAVKALVDANFKVIKDAPIPKPSGGFSNQILVLAR